MLDQPEPVTIAQIATALSVSRDRVAREIDGIGFKTADRIAINLGFANDAPPRLDAGLIYALETLQDEGHTAYREACHTGFVHPRVAGLCQHVQCA